MPRKSKIKRVAIFNHHQGDTTDATQPLLDYLLDTGTEYLINVRFPFLKSKDGEIETRIYSGKNSIIRKSLIKFYKPVMLSYLKDVMYSFFYGLVYCKDIDIFFGSPNILVLSGIFLKKIGFVKKVVYYIIDYTPKKYENSFINKLYFSIDKFVCYNADEVWSLNRSMIDSRISDRGWKKTEINIKIVPYGNDSSRFKDKDYKDYDPKTIVYFGGISKSKGSELLVPIAKELVKRKVGKFKFLVMGGGDVDWLKEEVSKAKLKQYFEITGPIETHKEVENRLIGCGVALAPYYPEDKNNFSYYSDPAKIKFYLACGLPIVITDVPPIARALEENHAGLISKYNASDFADKITRIIQNNITHKKYKQGSIKFGKEFDWKKIFNNVFKKSNIP